MNIIKIYLTSQILLFLINSCNQTNRNEVHQVIVNLSQFKDSSIAYAINYYTLDSNLIDSQYVYDEKDNLKGVYYYLNGKETRLVRYSNTQKTGEFDYVNNILTIFDEKGKIKRIDNLRDSTRSIYYSNSNKLKTFHIYDFRGAFYTNEYDSLSNKVSWSYRRTFDSFRIMKDTLILELGFPEHLLDIKLFHFKLDILDKKGRTIKSISTTGNNPIFMIPMNNKKHLEWNKTICDSIGCFSILGSFTNNFDNQNN